MATGVLWARCGPITHSHGSMVITNLLCRSILLLILVPFTSMSPSQCEAADCSHQAPRGTVLLLRGPQCAACTKRFCCWHRDDPKTHWCPFLDDFDFASMMRQHLAASVRFPLLRTRPRSPCRSSGPGRTWIGMPCVKLPKHFVPDIHARSIASHGEVEHRICIFP